MGGLLSLLVLVVVPLLGLGIGRLLRPARSLLLSAAIVVGGWWLVPEITWLAPWDCLVFSVLLAGGVAIGAARPSRDRVLLGLAASVIGLLLAEGLAYVLLPEPPRPPVPAPELLRDRRDAWPTCDLLFADPHAVPGGVLHLGDSMVEGYGIEDDFVSRLGHVNLGVRSTGPDYHLVVLRRRLRVGPSLVVAHFFAGNDLQDIDRPYTCCDDRPLLTDEVETRCLEPKWPRSTGAWLQQGSAPWIIRVAVDSSRLAAHALAFFSVAALPARPATVAADPWPRYRAILTAMKRECGDVELVVVFHPLAFDLEQPPPAARRLRSRIGELCVSLDIRLLDLSEPLRAAARESGIEALYLLGKGDVHDFRYSSAGHALISDWLKLAL